jgi:hypothetical protein
MMRRQRQPLDPFGLLLIGMGIWMTEVVIARQMAQALTEQNMIAMRSMGDRRLSALARSAEE